MTTETQAQTGTPQHEKLAVVISYNGMKPSFDYEAHETVESMRVRALDHYGIRGPERDVLFLFAPNNQTELVASESMGSQVQPGTRLYLRRRGAGGG